VVAKIVALIQILIQSQTTKAAVTKKIVDLIRTVLLNIVNKRFPFKKLTLNKYVKYIPSFFSFCLIIVLFRVIFHHMSQGALKLKITMKGPKKEDSEKIKCEKNRRNVTKKLKTNQGNKVIVL